jgi:catalase
LKAEYATNIWFLIIAGALSQTLDNATATRLAGEAPEYGIDTLFNDIEHGKFPTWTVYVVHVLFPYSKHQDGSLLLFFYSKQ